MKITIINSERNEKRYTREEFEEFVAQLRDGTYRQQYARDFNKEVCFAAEWVKLNGELKAKSYNSLILLSLGMSIHSFGWQSHGNSFAQCLPQAALHLFVAVGNAFS